MVESSLEHDSRDGGGRIASGTAIERPRMLVAATEMKGDEDIHFVNYVPFVAVFPYWV